MWYRQYSVNTARVVGPFSPDDILSAAKLVVAHYRVVLASWHAASKASFMALRQAHDHAESFLAAVTRSPAALERYAAALNCLSPRYVWWWCVAHPELEATWRA
jgi:hypothetical protein